MPVVLWWQVDFTEMWHPNDFFANELQRCVKLDISAVPSWLRDMNVFLYIKQPLFFRRFWVPQSVFLFSRSARSECFRFRWGAFRCIDECLLAVAVWQQFVVLWFRDVTAGAACAVCADRQRNKALRQEASHLCRNKIKQVWNPAGIYF